MNAEITTVRDFQQELFDQKPTEEWLNIADLLETVRVGRGEDGFQRAIVQARAKEKADNFNPKAVGRLVVSKRADGTHWLIDGQHRATAMRMLAIDLALCDVYSDLTREQEDALWNYYNVKKTAARTLDAYHSDYGGGDRAVRAIQNVLSELGYYVPITYNRMTRAITCVGVLREVYRYGSAMALRDVLTVANQAWPNDSHATDEKILYGLHVFLGSFRIQADRDRLVKRLKTTTPLAILADANASRRAYHDGARKIVAHEILNLYNYRISDANRLSGEKIHRFRSSPRSGGLS